MRNLRALVEKASDPDIMRGTERHVPGALDVHPVVDNSATHKTPAIRGQLGSGREGMFTSPDRRFLGARRRARHGVRGTRAPKLKRKSCAPTSSQG